MRCALALMAATSLAACSQGSEPAPAPTETVATDKSPAPIDSAAEIDPPPAPLDGTEDAPRTDRAPLQDKIPARFHGTFAEDLRACGQPSHGLFTIRAKEISFFESTGEVRNVRVDGDYAAATVFEQYGDSPGTTYAFYMRLLPDGSLRYSYDGNERLTWVRCP